MNIYKKVLLVGSFSRGALENSYYTAFKKNNCIVEIFDINASQNNHIKLGKIGKIFNKFVPVEPWIRKCNRELFLKSMDIKPDLILVFGQNRVMTGTIAQIKTSLSTKIGFIWQDSLVFLNPTLINSLTIYDYIFTYSNNSVEIIRQMGAKNVKWLPLAADDNYHNKVEVRNEYISDLTFIGQWRPEREKAIKILFEKIPGIDIKIWGLDWIRFSKNKYIKKAWQGSSLYGRDFSAAISSTKLNLNVIDDTNYPAANMRFFEIPCSGGIQICSSCPEMEAEFKNYESILYFKDDEELIKIVKDVIDGKLNLETIKLNAMNIVLNQNTYQHRASEILNTCFL